LLTSKSPEVNLLFSFFPCSQKLQEKPNSTINPGSIPKNDFEIFIGGPVFKFVISVFSKVKIIVSNKKFFWSSVPFVFQPGRNGENRNQKHK
jgi:hypothetical protein